MVSMETTEKKSPRAIIQEDLLAFLSENDLAQVYGAIEGTGKSTAGKPYRSLTFCRARVLDGSIEIYGPKFIVVSYQTAYRHLPHQDRKVFTSVEETKRFLKETFVTFR